MPNFPSINTLTQKPTLTGDEVIQISATEKTSLREIINQLGFNTSSILSGLNSGLTPGIGIPTQEDTLLEALGKLIARAGSNRLFIMPEPTDSIDHPSGSSVEEMRFLILADTFDVGAGVSGYMARLTFRESGIFLNIIALNEPIVGDYSTITELSAYFDQHSENSLYLWGYTCDIERVNATDSIGFGPGDVIYHTGSSISHIVIYMYLWLLKTSGTFNQYTATIVTKVNIIKNMFDQASGGNISNVKYLFMEGFDDDPGTEYQCVTIQRINRTSTDIILLVNKCGYSE